MVYELKRMQNEFLCIHFLVSSYTINSDVEYKANDNEATEISHFRYHEVSP